MNLSRSIYYNKYDTEARRRLFSVLRYLSTAGKKEIPDQEDILRAIVKITLAALVSGAMFAPGVARAQQSATQASLVGTWMLVSETAHKGDKTTEPLGPHPVGSIMFDQGGRFMLLIARPGLPRFAANTRDAGTPEENKAVLAGLLAFIGTYSVSEADQVLVLHVEASTFPNWVGADQKRYLTLTGSEQKWTNRTPAIGAEVVKVVWRRAP